jgi:hypothetical protein
VNELPFHIGSMRAEHILATLNKPKRVQLSMYWYNVLFIQTSTLTLIMDQKLIEHGKCCMHNNITTYSRLKGLSNKRIPPLSLGQSHKNPTKIKSKKIVQRVTNV